MKLPNMFKIKQKIIYLSVISLIIPNLVLAQDRYFSAWFDLADSLIEALNIPKDLSRFPALFYFVFLPFIGTFIVIYGILDKLKIFDNKRINVLLSLLFSVSLLYFGIFLIIIELIYSFSSFTIVILFALLLIFAVLMWSRKTYRRIRETY